VAGCQISRSYLKCQRLIFQFSAADNSIISRRKAAGQPQGSRWSAAEKPLVSRRDGGVLGVDPHDSNAAAARADGVTNRVFERSIDSIY